jgi:hypothetical protein
MNMSQKMQTTATPNITQRIGGPLNQQATTATVPTAYSSRALFINESLLTHSS